MQAMSDSSEGLQRPGQLTYVTLPYLDMMVVMV